NNKVYQQEGFPLQVFITENLEYSPWLQSDHVSCSSITEKLYKTLLQNMTVIIHLRSKTTG
ncbi:MAG: hypothetical protein VYC02_10140, partial [SAR324 cluster bacterium]|nr:hypothetical protein [SAR324 cluster bacterium]